MTTYVVYTFPDSNPFQGPKTNFNRQFLDEAARKRMVEAEDVDVNSAMHGNWTMENAKSKINQFMQEKKIKAEYKFSTVGPDHNR